MILIACSIQDVVAGLTIACAILVVGLFVPVVGGILWQRATIKGAVASVVAGIGLTVVTMAAMRDIYANVPVYVGLSGSLIAFIAASLADRPVAAEIRAEWLRRSQEPAADRSASPARLAQIPADE